MTRFALVLIACATLVTAGCRERPNYAYSYHKSETSQEQLLRDQQTLRKTSGVVRVVTTHHQDGSATIEVEAEDGHDVAVQQKLSAMGYQRGQH